MQIFTQDGELLAVIGGNLMRIGAVWISGSLAYIGELDGGITVVDMDFHVLAQLGCKGSVIQADVYKRQGLDMQWHFTNLIKKDSSLMCLDKQTPVSYTHLKRNG